MTPAERKAEINRLSDEIRELRSKVADLVRECQHKILPQEPDVHGYGYGYAECEGLGTVETKVGKSWKTFEEKRKKDTIL